ncbi:MAG TPA: uracil-DNA glycosylase [Humisphaera sp.]|jgi:uracil-DNA glycosylase|nr:uracil-DNA glycosylase [Humisphaera sp.]
MSSTGHSLTDLPGDWRTILADEIRQPYFQELAAYVATQRRERQIFPADEDVYAALAHTPHSKVRALMLGQDPYHDIGQAHGLCFSVREGSAFPPSLLNIFKELKSDVGIDAPKSGCLTRWADQGVLLLNAVLTVRAHEANSHKGRGWERFTDAIIRKVNEKAEPVVFVLWGGYAQKKEPLIDSARHTIIKSAHPSPLSARNGFFGSRPFSRINSALKVTGRGEIDWRL